ncbi:MAG: hypothetical protein M3Z25_23050 [Actinomycetota bacterium]|nr:hypothetical protein [Actinomycetota bacterium]
MTDYVGTQCFQMGAPGTVGVEVEWLTVDVLEPRRRVHPRRCQAALADLTELPGGSRISYEPEVETVGIANVGVGGGRSVIAWGRRPNGYRDDRQTA